VSLLPSLLGLANLAGGAKGVRYALPAIVLVLFMVPLPYPIEAELMGPFRDVATQARFPVRRRMGLSLRRALETPDTELVAVFGPEALEERDQLVEQLRSKLEAEGIEPGPILTGGPFTVADPVAPTTDRFAPAVAPPVGPAPPEPLVCSAPTVCAAPQASIHSTPPPCVGSGRRSSARSRMGRSRRGCWLAAIPVNREAGSRPSWRTAHQAKARA